MITIITGEIHQGKTKLMKALYNKMRLAVEDYDGDGFLAVKVVEDDQVVGYDYYRLSNGVTGTLSRKYLEEEEAFTFGPYSFSQEGFSHMTKVMEHLLEEVESDLYLDEIGPIELSGAGFSPLLQKMIEREGAGDIYITVRKAFVDSVINKFKINDYRIIEVE